MKKRKQYVTFLLSRSSQFIFHGVICFLCLFSASTAWTLPDKPDSSQEPFSSEEVEFPQKPSSGKEKDMADNIHDTVTSTFLASAKWVDSFFDDERVVQEENQSTLRVYSEFFKQEGDSADFNLKFRLRLVLPRAVEKLSMVVSGDGDDESTSDNSLGDSLREDFEGRDETNISTSLLYSFLDKKNKNLSLSLGFRLSGGSPVVYAGPRYRGFLEFGSWNIRFIERIRYYSDNGWESRTIVDFERPVFEDCLFRTTLDGSWFETLPGYYYDVSFVLYQPLKSNRALQYELLNSIRTRPDHQLDIASFRVRYRQKIWKDWLFFEVGPQVSFPRSRDFDITPGIYLRLEAIFGKNQDISKYRWFD